MQFRIGTQYPALARLLLILKIKYKEQLHAWTPNDSSANNIIN